jgi:hypothetical protein
MCPSVYVINVLIADRLLCLHKTTTQYSGDLGLGFKPDYRLLRLRFFVVSSMQIMQ